MQTLKMQEKKRQNVCLFPFRKSVSAMIDREVAYIYPYRNTQDCQNIKINK